MIPFWGWIMIALVCFFFAWFNQVKPSKYPPKEGGLKRNPVVHSGALFLFGYLIILIFVWDPQIPWLDGAGGTLLTILILVVLSSLSTIAISMFLGFWKGRLKIMSR